MIDDIALTPASLTMSGAPTGFRCRFCGSTAGETFVDLGKSPLCESYLDAGQLNEMEPFYPLHALVCTGCWLVQLQEYVSAGAIFSDYAYFSSYSDSWLRHAEQYVSMISARLELDAKSQVIELASNDGYLLQYFLPRGVPVLGIEPAANVAAVAQDKGIPSVVRFFGTNTAQELRSGGTEADLLIGNNVLAHVPDLNDFVAGMRLLLKPHGVITMEFPHLMRLMAENQFDTIYHEHFSYFSFITAEKVFAKHGLCIFDVEELPTHGGSLRIYARHAADHTRPVSQVVTALRNRELAAGFTHLEHYRAFTAQVQHTKRQLLTFLIEAREAGKQVAGYGAPGKGNTLLNYCGIRTDLVEYTVDRSPHKQGKWTPGTQIPIFDPKKIRETQPDYLLILPWNLRREIMEQMAYIRDWGGQFVVPIPEVTILP